MGTCQVKSNNVFTHSSAVFGIYTDTVKILTITNEIYRKFNYFIVLCGRYHSILYVFTSYIIPTLDPSIQISNIHIEMSKLLCLVYNTIRYTRHIALLKKYAKHDRLSRGF